MVSSREDTIRRIVDAVARSVDTAKLARELDGALATALARESPGGHAQPPGGLAASPPADAAASPQAARPSDELLGRLLLADILDDSILGARAGDKAYPLRLLLTTLGESLGTDEGLSFASALNVYFRVEMEEEVKMRLGVEASRLFYRFAAERALERDLVSQASPLLATVLGGELERLRFETVDNAKVFDSQVHERTRDSDAASPRILSPASFLCRVTATNMVRARALVRT
jgi:hypothetical protein